MFSSYILITVVAYFGLLFLISRWTAKGATENTFYKADKASPWYLVAFGMIGASLSGVTFISVPGWVNTSQFTYMQMVMGYLVGYWVIAQVLMPLYYRLNLTTIYAYFQDRIGERSHLTASYFFILSRIIGASFRLYLVVMVLQTFVFDALGIPFWISTLTSIGLIWVYTFRGGIKTVVWTDTLQTAFMLIAVVVVIAMVLTKMDMSIGDAMTGITEMGNARWFNLDSILEKSFFPRHFLSGALIAVVMTGMDQDMMQKNLTCRNIGEAKKNIFWFSISLFFVNIVFLFLGGLLYLYADQHGMDIPKGDQLFPLVAKDLGVVTAVIFTLGVIAAAYSSADSALTSLTTSFSLDILKMKEDQPKKRYIIHAGFSLILFMAVVIFEAINDESVIVKLFTVAGYTYGPILGLFSFSLMSKRTVKDQWVPYIAIGSVIVTFLIAQIQPDSIGGFKMGFELLLINGICTWSGLFAISKK
jgi:Na+/proline symporter